MHSLSALVFILSQVKKKKLTLNLDFLNDNILNYTVLRVTCIINITNGPLKIQIDNFTGINFHYPNSLN